MPSDATDHIWTRLHGSLPLLGATATIGICLRQVVLGPVVGLADNGDFARLIGPLGLRPAQPSLAPIFFAQTHFVRTAVSVGDGYTTSLSPPLRALVAVVARLDSGRFDTRVLATAHVLALGILVWALIKAMPTLPSRLIASCVLVVALVDSRLVAYFNSFYTEPWSLLLTCLVAVLVLRANGRRQVGGWGLALFALVSVALVATKTQDIVLALPLAAALGLTEMRTSSRTGSASWWRRKTLPLAAAGIVVIAAFTSVSSRPSQYATRNLYDAIFSDLVVYSPAPASDLQALGLPRALVQFRGTSAYGTNTALQNPSFQSFARGGGTMRLWRFYLTHPQRAGTAIIRGSRKVTESHLTYLGYRTAASGARPWSDACEPCLYSGAIGTLRPVGPLWLAAIWGFTLFMAGLSRRRGHNPGMSDALVVLTGMSALSFFAAVFGEGNYEEVRHLYLAYTINVLLLALALAVFVLLFTVGAKRAQRIQPTSLTPDEPHASDPTPAVRRSIEPADFRLGSCAAAFGQFT